MPHQPSLSQVHVNRPLTSFSIAYIQSARNFVANRVAPSIPVQKQSDAYFKHNKGDFFRDEMKKRAPATESAGSGWNISTETYLAEVWALHKDIPDQIRANQDAPLDMERDATIFLTHKALLRKEKIFSANFMTTGVWTAPGSDATPGAKWDEANSTPIADLRNAITAVQAITGFRPNRLTLGQRPWNAIIDNPDFISRVSGGQTPGGPAVVAANTLAAILEIDEVLVLSAIENVAQEGAADSLGFIAGNDTGALISYAATNPGLMMPSAMYTFTWNGYLGANAEGGVINTMRMPLLKADRVEIEMAFDMKLVGPDLGFYYTNVLNAF